MIGQPATFAGVNDETPVVRLDVVVLWVGGEHLAHVDAKTVGQDLIGRAHGRVVSDEQERASGLYPVADRIAFGVGERGTRSFGRIHLRGPKRVRNNQNVEAL